MAGGAEKAKRLDCVAYNNKTYFCLAAQNGKGQTNDHANLIMCTLQLLVLHLQVLHLFGEPVYLRMGFSGLHFLHTTLQPLRTFFCLFA